MREDQGVSEEILNAYVDGQLDGEELGSMLRRMDEDKALAWRASQQRAMSRMVREAYALPAVRGGAAMNARSGPAIPLRSLAAGLVLALGVAGGWLAHDRWGESAGAAGLSSGAPRMARLGEGVQNQRRVILNISSSRPEKLQAALDEAENLLAGYADSSRQLQLEVVASSDGLNLLRADVSPSAKRIEALRAKYPNLVFLACRQSVDRLRAQGIPVKLLPGVDEAPSALDQVVLRLRQGWDYIKV